MSELKLTADSGGGTVSIKGPSTTGSNGNREFLLPDTYSGNGSLVTADSNGDILLADSDKLKLGTGSDLQIYHDGSHSFIDGTTTGDLYLRSTNDDVIVSAADDIVLQVQGSETGLRCNGDGAVELYYDNNKKLETTSDGVNVSGQSHIINSGGNAKLTLRRSNTASNTDDYGTIRFQSSAEDNNVVIGGARESAENDGYLFISTSSGGTTSERIRLDSSGKLGIGTTSPTQTLHVHGASGSNLPFYWIRAGSSVGGYLYSDGGGSGIVGGDGNLDNTGIYMVSDTRIDFRVNGSERMRIDSSGNIGMGLTAQCTTGNILNLDDEFFIGFGNGGSGRPDFQIGTVVGNNLDFRCGFGSDAADLSIGTNGVFTGDFSDTSDERLKDNIQDISDNQINIVKQLRPVTFDWKETDKGSNTGFIAQEVIKLLPNDVAHSDPTNTDSTLGINNMGLIAVLTKALQEAIAKIETLETKVAALEAG